MEYNIKKNLKLTRDAIKAFGPEHFSMRDWLIEDGHCVPLSDVGEVNMNRCNTTACIAGHAAALMAKEYPAVARFIDRAAVAEWLGIPDEELKGTYEGPWLFYVADWPRFGDMGREAARIAEKSEYEGALYLLDQLIKREYG